MSHPTPPQIQAAVAQFTQALRSAEGTDLDPLTAPWADVEKGVIKLLGGKFSPEDQSHRTVAFMVGAVLSERLARDLGAFFFPNRSSPQGASVGFPDALVMFSPFEAAAQALARAKLPMLDEVVADLRRVLAEGRNPGGVIGGASEPKLEPADYQRLFDPGFVQFLVVDPTAAKTLWDKPAGTVAKEVEDALGRLGPEIPADVREGMKRQIVGALRQLDANKPLADQLAQAPQLVELTTLLHGATAATGFAPAEFWEDVLLPLFHIGPADSFPPLDEDEVEPYKKGAEAVLLYVDAVPFKVPARDEDGLLGVFPPEEVLFLDRRFADAPSLRLARVSPEALREAAARFDGPKLRASVEKFQTLVEEKAGPRPAEAAPPAGQPTLLDVGVALLGDLARIVKEADEKQAFLCIRRSTEAEASSEPALHALRKALSGPRIILAGS
jgi:hypothetical protein